MLRRWRLGSSESRLDGTSLKRLRLRFPQIVDNQGSFGRDNAMSLFDGRPRLHNNLADTNRRTKNLPNAGELDHQLDDDNNRRTTGGCHRLTDVLDQTDTAMYPKRPTTDQQILTHKKTHKRLDRARNTQRCHGHPKR